MKKRRPLFVIALWTILPFAIAACSGPTDPGSSSGEGVSSSSVGPGSSDSNPGASSSSEKDAPASSEQVTEKELEAYLDGLRSDSESGHLYIHYKKHQNVASAYADWDLWIWQYAPDAGEGAKFDWAGRTQSADHLSATGDATTDKFGGAYADIDLSLSYDGGWNNASKKIGGEVTSFKAEGGGFCDKIGIQVVKTSTRSGSSFWQNDGSNLYISLADYAFTGEKGTSYHVYLSEDDVQNPAASPKVGVADPFANDDGTNVTYGNDAYYDVSWTDKELSATSPLFLSGDKSASYLQNGAGVGYQIFVPSFADSDGDGFGDIYGVTQKLDYIKSVGASVIWLTPIQLSDSYHGYDIADYNQVDPKFGSSVSPAAKEAGGVSSATAMEDYKELLETAHEKGMAVLMDLVINHTSTSNRWFIESAKLSDEYRGYYQWGNHETSGATINEERYWYPYGEHVYSYYAKFGSAMPELNYSYASTRAAVTAIAKNWAEIGVDGFRMDAVKHIFLADELSGGAGTSGDTIIKDVSTSNGKTLDYSSDLTKNLNFWRELNHEVKKDYPNCFFVGENFDGHAYHVAPFYEGFDSLFDFYSYFNITNGAAKGRGSTVGGNSISAYSGATSGSMYQASADNSSTNGLSGSTKSIKYGGTWDFAGILDAEGRYRSGDSSFDADTDDLPFIGGGFTSNHDIARPLNRIAGTGDSTGLTAQGTVTSANYASLLDSAACMEIVTLLLPGLSWIYYGDELGMTGNFLGDAKASTDSYADLAYRQPMKWTASGQAGDGSYTTSYAVTGSGAKVTWDDINSSNLVVAAEDASTNEHFQAISAFAKAKASSPSLIKGSYHPYGWNIGGKAVDFIYNVGRGGTSENPEYNIVVNFSSTVTADAGFTGEVVASFNGASKTSLPPLSALLIKN